MAAQKPALHQQVTDLLVQQLAAGNAPWQIQREVGQHSFLPVNPSNGERYSGVNAIWLAMQGYADPRWMSVPQVNKLGGWVRRGERASQVLIWSFEGERTQRDSAGRPLLGDDGETLRERVRLERPRAFCAGVFNGLQTTGLQNWQPPPLQWEPAERVAQLLAATGVKIEHVERRAVAYDAVADVVRLPSETQFASSVGYYSTLLQSLCHWTGHRGRLNREVAAVAGSDAGVQEQLRAAIASMMIADRLGIGNDPSRYEPYRDSWTRLIQQDSKVILRIAAQASEICRYLLRFDAGLTRGDVVEQGQGSETASVALETGNGGLPVAASHEGQAEPLWLAVPFEEKDDAKALGAKWDPSAKCWYVPAEQDGSKFAKWLPVQESSALSGQQVVPAAQLEGVPESQGASRRYLAVPFSERSLAREAGARWDAESKCWYAPAGRELGALEQWRPRYVEPSSHAIEEAREAFATVLREMGCVVKGAHPIVDGSWQRITVAGDEEGQRSAGYKISVDGDRSLGYVKNHLSGEESRWHGAPGERLDEVEVAQLRARVAERRQNDVLQRRRAYDEAAARFQDEVAKLQPIKVQTPYLEAKKVAVHDGLYTDRKGGTVVPLYNAQGEIRTLQYIDPKGHKKNGYQGQISGSFHVVGGLSRLLDAEALILARSYATAATLTEILGQPVIATTDNGNLGPVAQAVCAMYPEKPLIIAGDDDYKRVLDPMVARNPGAEAAQAAAVEFGGTVLLPPFSSEERMEFRDWNDLATRCDNGYRRACAHARAEMKGVVQRSRAGALQSHEKHERTAGNSATEAFKRPGQRRKMRMG